MIIGESQVLAVKIIKQLLQVEIYRKVLESFQKDRDRRVAEVF